jgi:hypothetical protein
MADHRTRVEVRLGREDTERLEAQQLASGLSRAGVLRMGLRVLEKVEGLLGKKISN